MGYSQRRRELPCCVLAAKWGWVRSSAGACSRSFGIGMTPRAHARAVLGWYGGRDLGSTGVNGPPGARGGSSLQMFRWAIHPGPSG